MPKRSTAKRRAAYLLDDATKQLKLRSCWGLPKSRFLDPPRPLRGAAADLEALVGHAVVLEDTSFLPHWKVPEEFRSAVCVPISSPTFPFGTLWMFCDQPRDFSVAETQLDRNRGRTGGRRSGAGDAVAADAQIRRS